MTLCAEDVLGSTPVNIEWNIVRGDTATLRVDFLEEDEVTVYDITNWVIEATVYNPKNAVTNELEITKNNGWIVVTAEADLTSQWGGGTRYRANELNFDIQVTLQDNTVWTPVIGVISLISDVTGASL
jgi:hypothetical protein